MFEALLARPTGDRSTLPLTGRSLIAFEEPITAERFESFLTDLRLTAPPSRDEEPSAVTYLTRYGAARVPYPPEAIDEQLRFKYDIKAVDPERRVRIEPKPSAERMFALNPLKAMRIPEHLRWTGKGIRVAILDSGLECDHPELPLPIERDSRVPNVDSCDRHGHGTHCSGLIAGPRITSRVRPGYGAAPEAELIVIRALDDDLDGDDGNILNAMRLADELDADIVVMCMSANVNPVGAFETQAAGMLKNNRLLIAAAGNDSSDVVVGPVEHPANALSILAVAAIDDSGGPWRFSCGGTGRGESVDFAAPGEGIFSSYLSSVANHKRFDGTSQAAAYAAGVAALWAQSDSKYRGAALRDVLLENACDLKAPKLVGAGLVQAPE